MNKVLVIMFLGLSLTSYAQDSVKVVWGKKAIQLPVVGDEVVYETMLTFDSSYNEEAIYNGIKPAISHFFTSPNVSASRQTFKLNNVTNQIISEDPTQKTIIAYIMFMTAKRSSDPADLVPNVMVVSRGKFYVKGNKMKMIFEDIKYTFVVFAAALIGGAENSLLEMNFNDLAVRKGENSQAKVNQNIWRKTFTVDYKMKALDEAIYAEVNQSVKQATF